MRSRQLGNRRQENKRRLGKIAIIQLWVFTWAKSPLDHLRPLHPSVLSSTERDPTPVPSWRMSTGPTRPPELPCLCLTLPRSPDHMAMSPWVRALRWPTRRLCFSKLGSGGYTRTRTASTTGHRPFTSNPMPPDGRLPSNTSPENIVSHRLKQHQRRRYSKPSPQYHPHPPLPHRNMPQESNINVGCGEFYANTSQLRRSSDCSIRK